MSLKLKHWNKKDATKNRQGTAIDPTEKTEESKSIALQIEELQIMILLLQEEHQEEVKKLKRKLDSELKLLKHRIRSLEEDLVELKQAQANEAESVEGNFIVINGEEDGSSEICSSCDENDLIPANMMSTIIHKDCEYTLARIVMPESTTETTDETAPKHKSDGLPIANDDESGGDEHFQTEVYAMTDDEECSGQGPLYFYEGKPKANPLGGSSSRPTTAGHRITSSSDVTNVNDTGNNSDFIERGFSTVETPRVTCDRVSGPSPFTGLSSASLAQRPSRTAFVKMRQKPVGSRKTSPTQHKLSHKTDPGKVHKCTFEGCGKAFKKRSCLMLHASVHTRARPFRCDNVGCKAIFKRNEYLRKHKKYCKMSSH